MLEAQATSCIIRALVAQGPGVRQPDTPGRYPNGPIAPGHREDLSTYYPDAGVAPGMTASADWAGGDPPAARSRAWFAQARRQALDSYVGVDRLP